jgi:hypothetical protein
MEGRLFFRRHRRLLFNNFLSLADRNKIVGKKKAIYELKEWQIIALLVIITILNFTLVFSVIRNTIFSCVYSIAYFLATFYSAPPMRFKWRGWMGAVCDAIIEKPLPVLLVFIYFNHFHFDTLVFFAFMLCIVNLRQGKYKITVFFRFFLASLFSFT